ncbi:MAG: BrnT family toxin [Phycisphaeraceae bacterium]|nr:BrnT family toxin [Phycisphaeraceae bacterium]
MGESFEVCWDWSEGGNVAHIAEHGITPDEVEQVLADCLEQRESDRAHPDRWIVMGYTGTERFLVVAFELTWVASWNCWAVYPLTAFEPGEE